MVRYDVFFIKFSSSKHYLVVLCSTVNHCDHWLSDTERSIISRLKFWDWLFDTCSAILSRRLMANSTLEIVSYTQSLHYRWLVACCLRKVLPYKPTSCSLVGNRSWTISAENNRLDMLRISLHLKIESYGYQFRWTRRKCCHEIPLFRPWINTMKCTARGFTFHNHRM